VGTWRQRQGEQVCLASQGSTVDTVHHDKLQMICSGWIRLNWVTSLPVKQYILIDSE
jgi:hypothetical protein